MSKKLLLVITTENHVGQQGVLTRILSGIRHTMSTRLHWGPLGWAGLSLGLQGLPVAGHPGPAF